jgi:hypothetical protein
MLGAGWRASRHLMGDKPTTEESILTGIDYMRKRAFAHHFGHIIYRIGQEHGCINIAENAQVKLVCTVISSTVAFH